MEATDVVQLGQSRRDQTRRGFFRSVKISLPNRRTIEARPFDISIEGMGLTIDISLPSNTSCTLAFKLPLAAGETINVEVGAVVVYNMLSGKVGGFKTGLKFVDPPAPVADAIRAYLSRKLP